MLAGNGFPEPPHIAMKRLPLIVSVLSLGALPLSAAVVIADFNDLVLGDPRATNLDQTPHSGTGFADAYWAVNTGVPRIVAGDLTAPAATNYAVVQSGNARSFQSVNYNIADASDRRQARTLSTALEGVVWFSFLVHNAAADHSGGLDFNVSTSTFTTSVASRVVLEGTTLRVINAGSAEAASIAGVSTLGQTALIVGRIAIGASSVTAGNDVMSLWVNPVLTESSVGLGAATWHSNNTNFLGTAESISILGLQSYSTLTGSGQNGGVLDSVRLADGDAAYFHITGIPEPSAAGVAAGVAVLFSVATMRRRRGAGDGAC